MREYDYVITADSGCDLPADLLAKRGVVPIRMQYTMDGRPYTDGMDDVSVHLFYEKLSAGATMSTGEISETQFLDFWRPYAAAGRTVLHISLGSALSGSWKNGRAAAEALMKEYPGWEAVCLDSTLASAGCGLLVVTAAELKENGRSVRECASALEALKHSVVALFTSDDPRLSGRMSRTGAAVESALCIRPILDLDYSGNLELREKVRGDRALRTRFTELVCELAVAPSTQTLMISHADCIGRAIEFGNMLKAAAGFRDVYYTNIGPVVGAHTGAGFVSAFFIGQQRTAPAKDPAREKSPRVSARKRPMRGGAV